MKFVPLVVLAVSVSVADQSNAWGQIDLGNILRNEIQRGSQEIQREIRGVIREAQEEWRNPGPPQRVLPYPSPVLPSPIIGPIAPIKERVPPEAVVVPNKPTRPSVVVSTPRDMPGNTNPENAMSPENLLPEVMAGQLISLDGPGFGDEPGAVYLIIGELVLYAELVEWNDLEVAAVAPTLPMINAVPAVVAVMTADQEVVQRIDVQLVPLSEDTAEEDLSEGDNSQLPTVELGNELTLEGDDLGIEPGTVRLTLEESTYLANVLKWSSNEVTVKLPSLSITEPQAGAIKLFDSDGRMLSELDVIFENTK